MATTETFVHAPEGAEAAVEPRPRDSSMPRSLKRAISLAVMAAITGAVILFMARGDAFLIDLYSMTGLQFCF